MNDQLYYDPESPIGRRTSRGGDPGDVQKRDLGAGELDGARWAARGVQGLHRSAAVRGAESRGVCSAGALLCRGRGVLRGAVADLPAPRCRISFFGHVLRKRVRGANIQKMNFLQASRRKLASALIILLVLAGSAAGTVAGIIFAIDVVRPSSNQNYSNLLAVPAVLFILAMTCFFRGSVAAPLILWTQHLMYLGEKLVLSGAGLLFTLTLK